jgi:protocatechuate 3,4-dioxygenase beta subunit
MRLRLALTVLALALVATIAWVYADQIWGSRGEVPTTATPGDQDTTKKGEVGEKGEKQAAEADERTPLVGEAEAAAEPSHTSLRGCFASPGGVWPGGGQVALFVAPKMPEGGTMGMFSQGMQANRQFEKGNAKAKELEALLLPGKPVRTAELAMDGGFLLNNPPPGTFLVQIQHPHLINGRKVEVKIERGKHIDLGTLPTRLAGSLLVLVADPTGRPVAGAHVELHKQMDIRNFMKPGAAMDVLGMIRSMLPRSARTDSRGACMFESLDPETSWTLVVSSRKLVDENRVVKVIPGRRRVVTVELATGAELSLLVVDPDGKPRPRTAGKVTFPDLKKPGTVVGFGVRAGGDAVTKRWVTDQQGHQLLVGLAPGRCVVEVMEVGFLRQKKELVLTQDKKAEVRFQLDHGATVTGQVIDEEGKPIPAARVKHTKSQGFSILGMGFSDILDQVQAVEVERRGLQVDQEGRFVLGGMQPNEAVQILAAARGFDGQKTKTLRAGATGVVIRLRRQAQLAGVVHAADTNRPLGDFTVKVQKRSFMVLDLALVSEDFHSEDGSFLLEGVPRGRYEVVVSAKGRASFAKKVDFGGGGKVDIGEVSLELPAAVAGVVLDPVGRPVSGASVRAGKGGQMDSMVVAQVTGQRVVKTDDEGRFRLEGLTGAKVRLLVDKEGFAPLRSKPVAIQKGATTAGLELVLTKGGSILGQLANDAGKPMVGWIAQATHTSGLGVQMTETDAKGQFLLEHLAPGTHKVDCMPGDYMSRFSGEHSPEDIAEGNFNLGKMMASMLRYVVSERVVVRAGEQADVEMVFQEPEDDAAAAKDLVTVNGRVRVGGRDLEEGIVLLLEAGATVQAQMAHVRRGTFQLQGVRPGHYRVRVRTSVFSGPLGRPKSVQIPKGATHQLQLDFPGGRLAGQVVDENGRPAGGVVLTLRSSGDRNLRGDRMDLGEGTQLADAEGRFRFEGLGPGTYHLLAKEVRGLVTGGATRTGRLDGLRLGESEQRDGLQLQVQKGGTLLVKVTDIAGPRANALVTLLAADGQPMDLFHRALTEPDGTVTLGGIPAGTYRVNVDAPKTAPRISDLVDIQGGAEREVAVQLVDGIPAYLEVGKTLAKDHAGEVIRYSVWRSDGALVRSGRLTVPRDLEAFARAVGGRLSIGAFVPGRYRLRIEGPSLGMIEVERDVPTKGAAVW